MIETRINADARAKNPEMVANVLKHTPLNRAGTGCGAAGPLNAAKRLATSSTISP